MTTRLLKSSENINGLPIGFQEVEYLEANGTQWLDLGLYGNLNTEIEVGAYVGEHTTHFALVGDFTDSTKAITLPVNYGTSGLYSRFGNKSLTTGLGSNEGTYKFVINKTGYYRDGTLLGSFNATTAFTTTSTMMLFGFTNLGRNYYEGKVYYCKVYDNGTLVGDFIPALNTAGRPCMYDLVGKKAHYNLGTNEFTYGRKIIPVEYLESTGTQYIDTGYYPNNNTKYNLKTQFLNPATIQDYKGIIGVSVAPNDRCGMGFYNGNIRQQFGSGTATYGGNYNDSSYTGFNNVTVYECSRNGFYINGTLDWTPTKDFTGTASITAWLFNTHAEAEYAGTPQKLYYCKIYDNNTLVRDFIPCIDENNVGYMFDKITHTCYLNVGTGTFNYGKKLYSSKVRLYKDSEANKLPIGFKRVEYLENTGVSSSRNYISTGIVPDTTTKWEVRVSFNNTTTGKLMGSGYLTGNRFNLGIESNKFRFAFNGWFDANSNIITPDTNPHTWVMDATTKTFTIDEYSTTTTQNFGTSTFPIALFGRCNSDNGTTESSNAVVGKIYYSKIWQNNVLVRDMIPALDTTNTPCMYDTITQTAFYNQGTGQFTYGAVIVIPNKVRLPQSTEIRFPAGYTEVEYLESTGTQYINTGVNGNVNTKLDVLFSKVNSEDSNIHGIIGARGSTVNTNNISVVYAGTGMSLDFNNSNYATYRYPDSSSESNVKYRAIADKNARTLYREGVLHGSNTNLCTDTISTTNIWMFGLENYYKSNAKIYYAKIWDNGLLVRYFIPALDPNGKPCMWDVVTKQPFYNQGTGEFGYGRSIQQVSYLESTGTQYIDTGFTPTSKTRWEYDYQFNNTSSSYIGNGMFITSPSTQRFAIGLVNTSFNMSYGADNVVPVTSDTNRHNFIIDAKSMYWQIDNTTGTYTTVVTATLSRSIYFFARNGGSLYNPHSGKLYGSKIYDNDVFVRDYVPAIDSNNVGFMFDRVTHTIFDNKGTGSFNYGSLVPNKIRD